MSSRQEEYWLQQKGPLRCPRCGSENIYFNKKFKTWTCSREHVFSEPAGDPKYKPESSFKKSKSPELSKIRVNTQLRRILWFLFRMVVIAIALAVAAMALVAVSFVVHADTLSGVAIGIAAIGVILAFYGIGYALRRWLTIPRIFLFIVVSVIFLSLSWSYMDIESIDDAQNRLGELFSSSGSFQEILDAFIEKTRLEFVEITDELTDRLEETIQEIEGTATEDVNAHIVFVDGAILVGADWEPIILIDNPEASDPTWNVLKSFLYNDNTDEVKYNWNTFVCADFAEMLHNNAEAAGIKAFYVCVDFTEGGFGHALNAFETTDKGLVFVDCTGLQTGPFINADKTVDVQIGKAYIPISIFPEPGWSSTWGSLGIVADIDIVE